MIFPKIDSLLLTIHDLYWELYSIPDNADNRKKREDIKEALLILIKKAKERNESIMKDLEQTEINVLDDDFDNEEDF